MCGLGPKCALMLIKPSLTFFHFWPRYPRESTVNLPIYGQYNVINPIINHPSLVVMTNQKTEQWHIQKNRISNIHGMLNDKRGWFTFGFTALIPHSHAFPVVFWPGRSRPSWWSLHLHPGVFPSLRNPIDFKGQRTSERISPWNSPTFFKLREKSSTFRYFHPPWSRDCYLACGWLHSIKKRVYRICSEVLFSGMNRRHISGTVRQV